ncbi:uncharacterized protein F5147DRAFT_789540 [Suillus discolor]|uniref:Uncharacterized protein n=1 Tax=Suillus discolor TaxID=1912936 RepID=A0A9P7ETV2_9AGAM|nr:uncharacterized protein F5147DRAFT_789540 [Suillus discolor]KAG2088389.1 hypothetical protein F5147DRAFT_789540 [Suillus discolor]
MSWDELLDHRNEPFDISFPPAFVVHACDDQDEALIDSLVDCEIARDTDAEHFQLVLDQRPVSHPDHATALTNLAWACLKGYIRNYSQDIDATTSLFRDALALRPQPHPDHHLSLYNLTQALIWRHNKKRTSADIREAVQLYHELLPLRPDGTYLRSIIAGNGVDHVISACNNLPIDVSDGGIHLRRVVLELYPLGHQLHPRALDRLAQALQTRFYQHGSIDDLDTSIQLGREAVYLRPEGHAHRKLNDLDEVISLDEEALRLRLVGQNLKCGDIDDITRAISLYRESLTLRPPGHPGRDTTLNNLALTLKTRYDKSHVSEDLNEALDWYRESFRLRRLDHPERHTTLLGLSSLLCSRFTETQKNEDVEEAITLCQQSLAALSSLHLDRTLSYLWLWWLTSLVTGFYTTLLICHLL